jgi:uncharacterized protein
MPKALHDFQIFVKPTGSLCNMDCSYCYYKNKKFNQLNNKFRMSDDILEKYIAHHIEASQGEIINFSWHGGEPTLLGIDYFKKIVRLQNKYKPQHCNIINGIQTNGTLLDEDLCSFLFNNNFAVGISIDGPEEFHNAYRLDKNLNPTHALTLQGLVLLQKYKIPYDVLCVVHDRNVRYPIETYSFFKKIGVRYLSFLPLVELQNDNKSVTSRTVPTRTFGEFLCTIFDEWQANDIGNINIQIFEETIGTAFGREHGLCIFSETCGNIPVIEHNGDFYSCDHFVDKKHHIGNICNNSLEEMLDSRQQRDFGLLKREKLPAFCKECEVLSMCNGGCPKDRFINAPDGEQGLNYLCTGYKHFFTHSLPFIHELSVLWRERNPNSIT